MSNSTPIFEDLKKATGRLEEVLKLEKTEVTRDSAIKRFELCFDLSWKTIKNYARNQGLECYSPRDCFKTAFQLKLVDYDERWLRMIDDRNLTTHLYKEEYADEVYSRLGEYLEMFEQLKGKMS
jgi:nucleotidyltransferase substrate binding protein (TIGR01987 family)